MSAFALEEIPTILVDFLTIVLISVSGFYVYRQSGKYHPELKTLLILVHLFFGGVIVLEILRNFLSGSNFMFYYTVGGTSFVLWDVELLTIVACLVYIRPLTNGVKSSTSIIRHKLVGPTFVLSSSLIVATNLYLVILRPYSVIIDHNLFGVPVESAIMSPLLLLLLVSVLCMFAAFPSVLFIVARSKTRNTQARGALLLLPILWCVIGLDLIIVNGFILSQGLDAVAIGYLLATIMFGLSARLFRRTSLLSSFFEPTIVFDGVGASFPFTKRAGMQGPVPAGNYLLEVDSSTHYEKYVKDFAIELVSNGYLLFVFTPKASRVYSTLSKMRDARFYVMTSTTSYPRPTDRTNEMLVPDDDPTILLDTLRNTVGSVSSSGIGIIFDNVSDMILSDGFENSYKFMRRANEILADGKIVAAFLATQGAHEERISNLIQNLFQNHLTFDSLGVQVKRLFESTSAGELGPMELPIRQSAKSSS
jgi:hypothetical protein